MAFRPFIIDTTDSRCKYLFNSLANKGFRVREMAHCETDTYEVCILIFAPSKVINTADVENLKKGSAVFGGNASMDAKKLMSEIGISYFNILKDERFTVRNTIPTALGCIYNIMENCDACINDMKALVIGYGRVGKTLAKYLMGLDVNTVVYSADEKEIAMAEVFVCDIEWAIGNLSKYDLIINTVPARLIDKSNMDSISKEAFLIDLASGNYVDIDYLKEKGINAMNAPALPGRIAPKSAAAYMEECILDTLNKNSGLKAIFLIQ